MQISRYEKRLVEAQRPMEVGFSHRIRRGRSRPARREGSPQIGARSIVKQRLWSFWQAVVIAAFATLVTACTAAEFEPISVEDGSTTSTTERSGSTDEGVSVSVDPTLEPIADALAPLGDGGPRPLAVTSFDGEISASFVTNELLVTGDQAALDAIISRWDGEVIMQLGPEEERVQSYLVRLDPSSVDVDGLAENLAELAPRSSGDLAVSNDEGLSLIAAAAEGFAHGAVVGINWVAEDDGYAERSTVEDPDPDGQGTFVSGDAYQYTYMTTGSPQNTGVAEAWTLLHLAGRLTDDNKVRIAIIDSGFTDHPDLNLIRSTSTNGDDPLGSENPLGAKAWHGTGVSLAAAGIPDNGLGGAGPGGPVAEVITVHTPKDSASLIDALLKVDDAFVVNMSFGRVLNEWAKWSDILYIATLLELHESGTMLFASAGNGKRFHDHDPRVGFDVDEGETPGSDPTMTHPCEVKFVICVGALDTDTDARIGYSNFGEPQKNSAAGLKINPDDRWISDIARESGNFPEETWGSPIDGTVDIYAPTNIAVGNGPCNPFPKPNPSCTDPLDPSTFVPFGRGFSGTSAAAPFTAGVALLVKAADPSLTADEVEDIIMATVNTGSGDPKVESVGWVNALDAVEMALDGAGLLPIVDIVTPAPGLTLDENDMVGFQAVVYAQGAYTVNWSYEQTNGATYTFEANAQWDQQLSATPFCAGTWTVTAEAHNANFNSTSADTVVVEVAKGNPRPDRCATVEILFPFDSQTWGVDDEIPLLGKVVDRAQEPDVPSWRVRDANGVDVFTTTGLEASVSGSVLAEGTYTVYFEYPNGVSDSVTFNLATGEASENYVVILQPEDRVTFDPQNDPLWDGRALDVSLVGLAYDADCDTCNAGGFFGPGLLDGSVMEWSYRERGSSEWRDGGVGIETTIRVNLGSGYHIYDVRLHVDGIHFIDEQPQDHDIEFTVIGTTS